ncbi:MAG: hypothetical protein AAGD05_09400 [Bacteroidota bacterium]
MNKLNYEIIDQYVMGLLEEEALKAFESQLATDAQLAREVQLRRESLELIEDLGDLRLKKRLQGIHKEVAETSPPADGKGSTLGRSHSLYRWLSVAAVLLLLMMALFWWGRTAPKHQQLFAQHYEAYPLSFNSRSSPLDLVMAKAGALYNNADYEEAGVLFSQILEENPNSKAQFALGIAALEMADYPRALQQFEQLIAQKDPIYEEQAIWYKALIYLAQADWLQCREQLQLLTHAPFTFRRDQAQELLTQLPK